MGIDMVLQASSPQALGEVGDFGWMLAKAAIILVIVCILSYLVIRYVLRRILVSPGRSKSEAGHLVLVDRLALEPRRALVVVRAGSKMLLLGMSEGQMSLLAELDPHEWGEALEGRQESGFRRSLAAVLGRSCRPAARGQDVVALTPEDSEGREAEDPSQSSRGGTP